jgi:hypothetical protein
MGMKENEFYVLALRKKVIIPKNKIKVEVAKNGRKFAKGVYTVNGKSYKVSKAVASSKKC